MMAAAMAWMAIQITSRKPAPAPRVQYNPSPRHSARVGGSAWVTYRLLLAYGGAGLAYRDVRRLTGLAKAQADYALLHLVRAGLVERVGDKPGPACRLRYCARVPAAASVNHAASVRE